jgi:hypothetical protein
MGRRRPALGRRRLALGRQRPDLGRRHPALGRRRPALGHRIRVTDCLSVLRRRLPSQSPVSDVNF